MSDAVKTVGVKVFVQENGIIRLVEDGRYIGRLEDITFEEISQYKIPTITTKTQEIISYISSLESGTKISVRLLSLEFDVSHITAHKALKLAGTQGLIKIIPNKATVRI